MMERLDTRWRGTGCSHVGMVRASNQDAFALLEQFGLWIIADGMGGHAGGEVASRIAVETVGRVFESQATVSESRRNGPEDALRLAVRQANQAIHDEAAAKPDLTGMGTTLDILLVAGFPQAQAFLGHVGDSRAYLWRSGSLTQLTRDHSWVEEQLRLGQLSPQEVAGHALRHMLTRAVGTSPEVAPDIVTQALQTGDRILLCTDGLTKMLSDAEILDVLARYGRQAEGTCEALVARANEKGGHDNVTVVIVSDQAGRS